MAPVAYVVAAIGFSGNDGILSIDTSSFAIGGTPIDLGVTQATTPQITPDGKNIYVANASGVVQEAAIKPATVTNLAESASSVALSNNGKSLYACSNVAADVYVIRTSDNALLDSIAVSGVSQKLGITSTPNGDLVFVGLFNSGGPTSSVVVIDAQTNTVVTTISGGTEPPNFLASTNTHVYVASLVSGHISVISTSSLTVVATIPISGFSGGGMCLNAAGSVLYALDGSGTDGLVQVVDTSSNTIAHTITIPFFSVSSIALTPSGARLWVTGIDDFSGDGFIHVFNTSTNASIASFTLGTFVPISMGIVMGTSTASPTRQKPRDDNLALGAARQSAGKGRSSSVQGSNRQGTAGTYS